MTKRGRKITVFLIDGDPNGRIMCELSNWSGKAYRIPRNQVKISDDREDLNNTGVYLLFGKNDNGNNIAYIGEAENIKQRLLQHLGSKDFWNETIAFISKDNNLNKAHIKYLESRLYEIAKDADRYLLDNSTKPTKSNISEPDKAEMEEFIDNLLILVNTLGHKIFDPIIRSNDNSNEGVFQINQKGLHASGKPTNEGFVVFKGSSISLYLGAVNASVISLRERYVADGIVKEDGNNATFTKDVVFSSSSLAATMVLGVSTNGPKTWKSNGKTLKELQQ
ncbi:MAG: GIY-YIG nuclease family protein [Bacteroidales bacterium]|nr:GIY-YIG nuclease family protein [Bacteroidales bacterium]